MRKKPPRPASLDEVKITREGDIAVVEHADPNVSVARVNVGPQLQTMSDAGPGPVSGPARTPGPRAHPEDRYSRGPSLKLLTEEQRTKLLANGTR